MVHVIRLTSFLCVWFQCVCPLILSRNTYHLTWVSLTLDVGYLFTAAPPDLESGVAPLGPPAPAQPPFLGCGVAPLSCSIRVSCQLEIKACTYILWIFSKYQSLAKLCWTVGSKIKHRASLVAQC